MGNHYISNYNGIYIEVANFDAWVNHQLEYLNDHSLQGDAFDDKIKLLLKYIIKGKHNNFIMKNNMIAKHVFIDEFQDLEDDKVDIIISTSASIST